MRKIALIHFLPLEYYPPVTNMINYLTDEIDSDIKLSVFSTHNTKNRNVFYNKKVKIYRTSQSNENEHRLIRFFKYLNFQLSVIFKLLFFRPDKVLYYESLSSFPVYIYLRFIKPSAKLYIHYHEYTSPKQYATQSMAVERFFHKLEQKHLYKKALWISHTNIDRLSFFQKDNPNINNKILQELPNYPPKSWADSENHKKPLPFKQPLKCVYIGSLSLNNTYLREFTDWIINQKGKVTFDIFAYNLHSDTKQFLLDLHSSFINFDEKGVEYDNIPAILKNYHVGVIFYKAYSVNVINCVSNKFYEYYACGLDIWFSNVMKTTLKYTAQNESPAVIPVDFTNIQSFKWKSFEFNKNKSKSNYFCNDVYFFLKTELQK